MNHLDSIRCATIFVLAGACGAQTQPTYDCQRLPGLSGHGYTFAGGISEDGVALGGSCPKSEGPNSALRIRPMRWENGHPTPLPHLPGATGLNANAWASNSAGIIVGASSYSRDWYGELFTHAVLWDGRRIEDLGALPGDLDSRAWGINDAGVVVGQSSPDYYFFGGSRAFRYEGGAMSELASLPGQFDAIATGIDNAGVIVGAAGDFWGFPPWTVAVTWDQGGIHVLPLLPGDDGAEAHATNDAGTIVGRAGLVDMNLFEPFGAFRPVRWVNGQVEALPLLPGDTFGCAYDVNENGTIVGVSGHIHPQFGFITRERPVVWNGPTVTDLTTVAVLPSEWATFDVYFVHAINDAGQIVGSTFGEVEGHFVQHAFVLTPRP